jgi:hypothetical protein
MTGQDAEQAQGAGLEGAKKDLANIHAGLCGLRIKDEGEYILKDHLAAFLRHEAHVAAVAELQDGGFFCRLPRIAGRSIGAAHAERPCRARGAG